MELKWKRFEIGWGYETQYGHYRAWIDGSRTDCNMYISRHGVIQETGHVTGLKAAGEAIRTWLKAHPENPYPGCAIELI